MLDAMQESLLSRQVALYAIYDERLVGGDDTNLITVVRAEIGIGNQWRLKRSEQPGTGARLDPFVGKKYSGVCVRRVPRDIIYNTNCSVFLTRPPTRHR